MFGGRAVSSGVQLTRGLLCTITLQTQDAFQLCVYRARLRYVCLFTAWSQPKSLGWSKYECGIHVLTLTFHILNKNLVMECSNRNWTWPFLRKQNFFTRLNFPAALIKLRLEIPILYFSMDYSSNFTIKIFSSLINVAQLCLPFKDTPVPSSGHENQVRAGIPGLLETVSAGFPAQTLDGQMEKTESFLANI